DPLVNTNRIRINTSALGARLPTIYNSWEAVEAGGLMSYGANFPAAFRRAAELIDKVLRGAKPADIPVEQPTKFDLVINLTTAKALGLEVPPSLLARGGAAVAWPFAAGAQQRELRRIAVVIGFTESDPEAGVQISTFREELRKLGWIEG